MIQIYFSLMFVPYTIGEPWRKSWHWVIGGIVAEDLHGEDIVMLTSGYLYWPGQVMISCN